MFQFHLSTRLQYLERRKRQKRSRATLKRDCCNFFLFPQAFPASKRAGHACPDRLLAARRNLHYFWVAADGSDRSHLCQQGTNWLFNSTSVLCQCNVMTGFVFCGFCQILLNFSPAPGVFGALFFYAFVKLIHHWARTTESSVYAISD